MSPIASRLHEQLDRLNLVLERDGLTTFSEEEQRGLLSTAADLQQRLETLEDEYLTLGLLGGTGVGKSSVMNGLARSAISSVSHRRPHTEQVIIYRHEDAPPLPPFPDQDLPRREVLHRADPVRRVLLCDLPDFDSLMAQHRERAIAFLAHLDMVVWVTSPEKYADRRFYAFLEQTPKSRDNYVFVLNKADLLFEPETGSSSHENAAAATGRFTEHLREAGIHDPVVLLVSAREVLGSKTLSPWNQFPLFRQQVFQLRNAKQVRRIKSDNLDVEASRLFARLNREIRGLERLGSTLDRAVRRLKADRPTWEKLGGECLFPWLEGKPVRTAFAPARDTLPLIGPGMVLALLLPGTGRTPSGEDGTTGAPRLPSVPEPVVKTLQRHAAWLEDRVVRELLEENLPPALRERVIRTVRQEERFEDTGGRLFQVVSRHASVSVLPRMIGFRLLQYATYALLTVLLIFALGEASAWRDVTQSPGWGSGIRLLSSFVQTLFSPQGLGALGSYGLLNLFFGMRFLLGYRKRLKRATDRAVSSLKRDMLEGWNEHLDRVLQDLDTLREELEGQRKTLASLSEPAPPSSSTP